MSFDLSIVGHTTQPHTFTYDWKTVATYALGIGAKRDELSYLYENAKEGMKVYPTFAVVPSFEPITELLVKSGADLSMVVHGGQVIRVHRPVPASGRLSSTGLIKGIYDLKKFGQIVLETTTTSEGELLFDTVWSLLVRGAGGFNGPRPPEAPHEPSAPKDRPADWTVEETTSPEQALLYRISGDINPLHADPEFAAAVGFPQGPILHGLCTYGFAARALVQKEAGGDASRLRSYSAQFRKPVWPGDTIVTQGFHLDGGKVALVTSVKGRPEPVLANAWAEIG